VVVLVAISPEADQILRLTAQLLTAADTAVLTTTPLITLQAEALEVERRGTTLHTQELVAQAVKVTRVAVVALWDQKVRMLLAPVAGVLVVLAHMALTILQPAVVVARVQRGLTA
jgi:hypothetical protein